MAQFIRVASAADLAPGEAKCVERVFLHRSGRYPKLTRTARCPLLDRRCHGRWSPPALWGGTFRIDLLRATIAHESCGRGENRTRTGGTLYGELCKGGRSR